MLDGKPLLIVYGDNGEQMWQDYLDAGGKTKYTDKFTLRWADNQSRPGYYGWAYDQGTKQDPEVMVVMPGWDNRKGYTPVPRNHGEWYLKWVPALGYYDLANMAKRIPGTCRVRITRAGLGDYTCPPSGVAAFYNSLSCPKSIVWVQGSTHSEVPPVREAYER